MPLSSPGAVRSIFVGAHDCREASRDGGLHSAVVEVDLPEEPLAGFAHHRATNAFGFVARLRTRARGAAGISPWWILGCPLSRCSSRRAHLSCVSSARSRRHANLLFAHIAAITA